MTVRKAIGSLGEHCMAFLNANNKKGFLADDIPEEPVEELMALMFLNLLEYITKYEPLRGIKCVKIRPSKADIAKELSVLEAKRIRGIQIQRDQTLARQANRTRKQLQKVKLLSPPIVSEFDNARRQEFEILIENIKHDISRKHICATRTNFSVNTELNSKEAATSFMKQTPLQDYEYHARRARVMGLFYNITTDTTEYVKTIDLDDFMNLSKSNSTVNDRINPFIYR